MFEAEINTINTFGGTFVAVSEERDGELQFTFTKGGDDDPIQTLTVSIKRLDGKDVTTFLT